MRASGGAPRARKFLARLAGSSQQFWSPLVQKLLAPGRAPLDGLAHGQDGKRLVGNQVLLQQVQTHTSIAVCFPLSHHWHCQVYSTEQTASPTLTPVRLPAKQAQRAEYARVRRVEHRLVGSGISFLLPCMHWRHAWGVSAGAHESETIDLGKKMSALSACGLRLQGIPSF